MRFSMNCLFLNKPKTFSYRSQLKFIQQLMNVSLFVSLLNLMYTINYTFIILNSG